MNRREFLGSMAGLAVQAQIPRRIEVQSATSDTFRQKLAHQELLRGLRKLGIGTGGRAEGGSLSFGFRLEPNNYKTPDAYTISSQHGAVLFSAGHEQ